MFLHSDRDPKTAGCLWNAGGWGSSWASTFSQYCQNSASGGEENSQLVKCLQSTGEGLSLDLQQLCQLGMTAGPCVPRSREEKTGDG